MWNLHKPDPVKRGKIHGLHFSFKHLTSYSEESHIAFNPQNIAATATYSKIIIILMSLRVKKWKMCYLFCQPWNSLK